MPYKSISQIHKFFQLEKEGKIKRGTAKKLLEETDIKTLPQRKRKKAL